MFRRLESTLPPDFDFPLDLTELGYFINENDQIRMIEHPDRPFHFWISKNERYVERHREAFHHCIRSLIAERLSNLGLKSTRLPLDTPVDEPHIPVWVSKNIASCQRLIVYFGESHQDLGVFAGRIVTTDGINEGSAVKFVQNTQSSVSGPIPEEHYPGVVIANAGQLLWHRHGKEALTWESWYALKRNSAVGPGYAVTEKNKVPGNETPAAHIASVFKDIVLPQGDRHCEIFVIAVGDTAHDVFDFLQTKWTECAGKIQGLVILASNYVWQNSFEDEAFMKWFGERARAYLVSDEPVGTPLQGRSRFACNIYSGGEPHYVECLMRSVHPTVLDYFKLISQIPGYKNVPQDLDQDLASDPEVSKVLGWDDAEVQQEEVEKKPASPEEIQNTEPIPDTKSRQEPSAEGTVPAVTESLADIDLNPPAGSSTEVLEANQPETPILTPVDRCTAGSAHPFDASPNRTPTSAGEHSVAASQVRPSGYVTTPEGTLASMEDRVEKQSEVSIAEPVVTEPTELRTLDPNTSARARSTSYVSVESVSDDTSTSSPPPPPMVPNSTPEAGSTPEPDYRVGIGRNGSSEESSISATIMSLGGGSLIREVLRYRDSRSHLPVDGFSELDEGLEDEGVLIEGEDSSNGHSRPLNNEADSQDVDASDGS